MLARGAVSCAAREVSPQRGRRLESAELSHAAPQQLSAAGPRQRTAAAASPPAGSRAAPLSVRRRHYLVMHSRLQWCMQ